MCISETGAIHLNDELICYNNLEYVEVLDKMIGRKGFIKSLSNCAIFLISRRKKHNNNRFNLTTLIANNNIF